MLKKGSNIKHRDKINETPLFYAARDNRIDACKALIDGGIDINAVDEKRYTALYFAKK